MFTNCQTLFVVLTETSLRNLVRLLTWTEHMHPPLGMGAHLKGRWCQRAGQVLENSAIRTAQADWSLAAAAAAARPLFSGFINPGAWKVVGRRRREMRKATRASETSSSSLSARRGVSEESKGEVANKLIIGGGGGGGGQPAAGFGKTIISISLYK